MRTVKQEHDRIRRRAHWDKAIVLLGGKCCNCGTTEKLTFDHINNDRKGDKKRCIGNIIDRTWSKIELELAKCQLLCRSCHGHKTAVDFNKREFSEHGTIAMYTNKKCRCNECRGSWSEYRRTARLTLRKAVT